MKITGIDVGLKTGIVSFNKETNQYIFSKFKFKKSLTFNDLFHNEEIKELLNNTDVLLLEWQNDSWGKSNSKTQFELQRKTHMFICLFSLLKPENDVYTIRSKEVVPFFKKYSSKSMTTRLGKKEGSLLGLKHNLKNINYLIKDNEDISDDISDAFWFIQVFLNKIVV